MSKVLLIHTGFQGDAMFAAIKTHDLFEFDSSDRSASGRVMNLVENFVDEMEIEDGWLTQKITFDLVVSAFKTVMAVEDGDPRGQLSFVKKFTTEDCYVHSLWIGPAE